MVPFTANTFPNEAAYYLLAGLCDHYGRRKGGLWVELYAQAKRGFLVGAGALEMEHQAEIDAVLDARPDYDGLGLGLVRQSLRAAFYHLMNNFEGADSKSEVQQAWLDALGSFSSADVRRHAVDTLGVWDFKMSTGHQFFWTYEIRTLMSYCFGDDRYRADLYPWRVHAVADANSSEFVAVPWADELEPIADHYLKMSIKSPGMVSFYQTEEKAKRGLRTAMKPGRYLTRYYPGLSSDEVRSWVAKVDVGCQLEFASTADEIEEVYLNGPNSCMSHLAHEYDSPHHPVRVYAGPDLKLAYMRNDGKITARALVWPAKKLVGRIYGDGARLVILLEQAGYALEDMSNPGVYYNHLKGARIQRIIHQDDYLICPYIDGSGSVDDDGEYLVIGGSDYDAASTNGLIRYSRCDEDEDEDDELEVFWCPGLDDYVEQNPNSFTYIQDVDESWSDRAVARCAWRCPMTGLWYSDNHPRVTIRLPATYTTSGYIERECAEMHAEEFGTYDEDAQVWVHKDMAPATEEGTPLLDIAA